MRQPALLVFNVFSDCCVVAHDASEQSSAVYRAYRDYCARNDETARNQRDFYKVLDEAGFSRPRSSCHVRLIAMKGEARTHRTSRTTTYCYDTRTAQRRLS